ncbi:hypothetical protein CsSME_00002658 [Camellia sinensis var. sinensis]
MLGRVLGRGKGKCSSVDLLARLTMLPAEGVLRIGFILGSVIPRRTLLRKVGVLLGLCKAESIKTHDRTYAQISQFLISNTQSICSKATTFGGVKT